MVAVVKTAKYTKWFKFGKKLAIDGFYNQAKFEKFKIENTELLIITLILN